MGERSRLLRDFHLAKGHIVEFLMTKLRFWKQLPYIMIGISHLNEDLARECCKRGLALWASTPVGTSHHRVTRMLFSGEMYDAIVRFAAGSARDVIPPCFSAWAVKFAGVSVEERSIEARHAMMKAGARSATKVSEVYASLILRLPEIVERLDRSGSDGSVWESLVHFSNIARTPL